MGRRYTEPDYTRALALLRGEAVRIPPGHFGVWSKPLGADFDTDELSRLKCSTIDGFTAGIYRVTCAPTGDFYIGASMQMVRRWRQHLHEARNGRHRNKMMVDLYQRHGRDAFRFAVMEFCPKGELFLRERMWRQDQSPTINPYRERQPSTVRVFRGV